MCQSKRNTVLPENSAPQWSGKKSNQRYQQRCKWVWRMWGVFGRLQIPDRRQREWSYGSSVLQRCIAFRRLCLLQAGTEALGVHRLSSRWARCQGSHTVIQNNAKSSWLTLALFTKKVILFSEQSRVNTSPPTGNGFAAAIYLLLKPVPDTHALAEDFALVLWNMLRD